ncbi:MAG: 2Fe-2S iron-sulfur cluster binding domain-containing protein, partial [Schwartzia sp.]|nr:2Fe-2S iron-sulfur cluster binding domain-containing protein [Schwartzia sp. (in: firmicutes)]
MSCTVRFLPSGKTVCIFDDATIMDAEREAALGFEYPCGGTGTCGKCMVDIEVDGVKSRVKACSTKVSDGMIVTLPENNEHDEVMTSGIAGTVTLSPALDGFDVASPLGVAFDIGTTTIAAYLLDLSSGETIDVLGELNEQIRYGADVVSRCIFSLKNGVEEISSCVNKQADRMIGALLQKHGLSKENVCLVT